MAHMAKLSVRSQAFENTATNIAASQMRNALNNLTDTVKDPEERKVWLTEAITETHAKRLQAVRD